MVATAFVTDPERPLQAPEDPNHYDTALIRVVRLLWRDHPDKTLERLEGVLKSVWTFEANLAAGAAGPLAAEHNPRRQSEK